MFGAHRDAQQRRKHPLRACRTRFVVHKVAALERMIDRLGAYISHLTAMMEDSSVKPADKGKSLDGFRRKKTGRVVHLPRD